MILTPMRFDGYTWRHNPKSLTILSRRRTIELTLPLKEDIQLLGERVSAIEGSGELYGADCIEQYLRLYELYKRGQIAILSIPRLPAMRACMSALSFASKPSDDVLVYSFRFEKAADSVTGGEGEKSFMPQQDMTLWDIAYQTGVSVERLTELNPWIRDINAIESGRSVRLC